jgi:hypothetical protein
MSNPQLLGTMACIMRASFKPLYDHNSEKRRKYTYCVERLAASSSEGFRLLPTPPIGGFLRLKILN